MIASESLDSLDRLNRELIHLFVAGPGEGEGLALALPGSGWILVDGCAARRGLPLEHILKRWAGEETIHSYVLTHPHDDHVAGMVELLESYPPESVAVTTPLTPPDAPAGVASQRLLAQSVKAAMRAIDAWKRRTGKPVIALVDGQTLLVQAEGTSVLVRAPTSDDVNEFTAAPRLAERLRKEANHISAVIEVCYGETLLVLGADLPRYATGSKQPIRSGWDNVLARHRHLGLHAGLKIPHHGSEAAFHPDLMVSHDGMVRAWAVTPFSSSKLPRVDDRDGLPVLVQRGKRVHLTALPLQKTLQASTAPPGRVALSQLADRLAKQPTGTRFIDNFGQEVTPQTAIEPLDSVWCFAFDAGGVLRGRWRGRAALEVVDVHRAN